MFRTWLSNKLDYISRRLALREHCSLEEYQYLFDQHPEFLHSGAVERIQLTEPISVEGTNDLFRANYW
ncbi:MAG: serine/threonine protein kinase, partial [Fibrobacteraceae bacterium]|nr:serine/threonine protein kinase [Fibrobacteraceae bacterium]